MTSHGWPVPPQGRGWGPAKSSCAGVFAGAPAVARCSGSAAIATGATGIAASGAGKKHGGNHGGTPTGEAADLLQALNTGHGGSLTTVHANNAESALSRIASCAMQGGGELPWEVTCRGVVDGIAMVIHMTRREGRRFVEEAAFVKGYEAKENRWDIERLERVSLTS